MMRRVRLENIPQDIQEMFKVGPKVEAEADSGVCGGHFPFLNKLGQEVSVDAVELVGTGILIREL